MERITMTLKEKFESLTPEQREKLINVKTEGELDALLTETGIAPTAETKTAFLGAVMQKGPRVVTAEELGEIVGGHIKKDRLRISSPSVMCAHKLRARCDQIGVVRDGVVSYEKCGFLVVEGSDWICTYGGE